MPSAAGPQRPASAAHDIVTKRRYQHKPLPGDDYIRVLVLDHSLTYDDAPLTCSLVPRPLAKDAMPYTALSYSWALQNGDASPNHELLIRDDGGDYQVLAITENLCNGLRRFRKCSCPATGIHDPLVPCVLWIDAVCIDQTNILERGQQVAMMARIYAAAGETLVWFGDGYDASRSYSILTAFANSKADEECVLSSHRRLKDFIDQRLDSNRVSTYGTQDTGKLITVSWQYRTLPVRADSLELTPEAVEILDTVELDTEALLVLFKFRYFSRRWIVQELHHSSWSNIAIWWGAHRLPLSLFYNYASSIAASVASLFNWESIPSSVGHVVSLLNDLQAAMFEAMAIFTVCVGPSPGESAAVVESGEQWLKFLHGLSTYSHLGCSDDRDRLYAFASMWLHPSSVNIDYALPCEKVYTEFAATVVQKGFVEVVLYESGHQHAAGIHPRRISDSHTTLPSWVPDLRLPLNYTPARPTESHYSISSDGLVLECEGALSSYSGWDDFFKTQLPQLAEKKSLLVCRFRAVSLTPDEEGRFGALLLRRVKDDPEAFEIVGNGRYAVEDIPRCDCKPKYRMVRLR